MFGLNTIKKMNKQEYQQQKRNRSLQVYRLNKDIPLPTRGTNLSAGIDLYLPSDITLYPFVTTQVKLGLIVQPPIGHHTEIVLRSSIAKKGVILTNSVGIIDRDYAGPDDELGLLLTYLPDFILRGAGLHLSKGDRIAQLLIRKTEWDIPILEVNNPPLNKNRGGFGSTGN